MISPPVGGDTIVAVSSGRPPAAVAVVRTSGPQAEAMLTSLTGKRPPPPRKAALRRLSDPETGEPIDRALVLRFPSPASATAEDIVEYQCHGGRAVVDRLVRALTSLDGARLAEPGEFTRRALANGRIDLTEAEGLADLIEAETEAQRKAALQVAEGGVRKRTDAWRQRVVNLSAQAEVAIDYVGDEEETAGADSALAEEAAHIFNEIEEWLSLPRAERLKDGVRVVVAGPPNVGKSSLINALANSERAIVADFPGTTRDVIEVPVALDGLPLVLVDTAGLRDSDDPVERIGVARADAELRRADLVLWLGEADSAPTGRILRVYPRIDQPGRADAPSTMFAVSAKSGAGISALWSAIRDAAKDILPAEGTTALNDRQADCLQDASSALRDAASAPDPSIQAYHFHLARCAFDRLGGHAGVEDMLDALFSRFCLGK